MSDQKACIWLGTPILADLDDEYGFSLDDHIELPGKVIREMAGVCTGSRGWLYEQLSDDADHDLVLFGYWVDGKFHHLEDRDYYQRGR